MKQQQQQPLNIEIFVIDDDKEITELIGEILTSNHIGNFRLFNDPDELLAQLNSNVYICIVDYVLTDKMNGLELIKKVLERNSHCWFIMISGVAEKDVIIDYINMVNGSKYIEKGGKSSFNESLITYIKEGISRINSIENFYSHAKKIEKRFGDLKQIITA